MTEPTTTISVRGEARQVVPPDFTVIAAVISIREIERQDALDRAGRAQTAVLDALRERGGTPLTVQSIDAPLTWATQTFSAQRDEEWDERKARRNVGWRVHVPVSVTLRDLSRVDDLVAALAAIDDLNVYHVQWQVDARNPSWPLVRAAAIEDAIAKARDYAAALRGSITALVHVADEGLLGGQDSQGRFAARAHSAGGVAEFSSAPGLDPAPQEISAVVEARFEARVAGL